VGAAAINWWRFWVLPSRNSEKLNELAQQSYRGFEVGWRRPVKMVREFHA
jgi:hypothetical protein